MPYTTRKHTIGVNDAGRRLDRVIKSIYADIPLSSIYRMFRTGDIRISGLRIAPSHKASTGEIVEVRISGTLVHPYHTKEVKKPFIGAAAFFKEMILVETPRIVVVNKPKGVLTHGDKGIDEAAKVYFAERIQESLSFSPAPLHRLDRNTSGALAVSASIGGATAFSHALRNGLVQKTYLALITGELEQEERWRDRIMRDTELKTSRIDERGSLAEALAIPICVRNGYTLARIVLGTGRTHQIRVQAAAHLHPLAGDSKYGGKPLSGGYFLHCVSLSMPQGIASELPLSVEAPLPESAATMLCKIFGKETIENSFPRHTQC